MQRPSRFGACKTGRAAKAQTENKFGIGGGGDRSGWMKQKLLAPFASVLRSGLSLSARFFHNLAESSKMQYNRGCHVAHKIRVSAQGTRSVATSNFWEAERMRRRRHFCPRKKTIDLSIRRRRILFSRRRPTHHLRWVWATPRKLNPTSLPSSLESFGLKIGWIRYDFQIYTLGIA